MSITITESRHLATQYLEKYIPRHTSLSWISHVSSPPRFEWDVDGIQIGFTNILWDYLDRYQSRLRPILLIQILNALDLDIHQFSTAIVALEMLYIAGMMVDKMNNESSVSQLSTSSHYPIPVLLTTAYSARQFAPAIFSIFDTGIEPELQSELTYQFGSYLFQQGATLSMDYWNHQQNNLHSNTEAFINHIKLIATPLTFGLITDIVIAGMKNLNTEVSSILSQVSRQLGLAYRLQLLRDTNPQEEFTIRWQSLKSDDMNSLLSEQQKSKERVYSLIETLPQSIQEPLMNFSSEILHYDN